MGKYKKPKWAVKQIIRETGLVEDIDKWGVGHPNEAWLKEHDPDGKKCFGVHGCNGACFNDGKPLMLKDVAKMIGIKHGTKKRKRAVRKVS